MSYIYGVIDLSHYSQT